MNKILMDGDKLFYNNEEDIEVDGSAKIYITNEIRSNINLNITLRDNASLDIYDFTTRKKENEIIITQNNNSTVNYIHTFNIKDNYSLKYRSILNGNNNINNVYISGVTSGYVTLDVDGQVLSGTKNNELNENIRVLLSNGKCKVFPMLHVSAKEVLANHNTAISNVNEDVLFYLMSKGIDKSSAINLIKNSYIYGYLRQFDEEFYNLVK